MKHINYIFITIVKFYKLVIYERYSAYPIAISSIIISVSITVVINSVFTRNFETKILYNLAGMMLLCLIGIGLLPCYYSDKRIKDIENGYSKISHSKKSIYAALLVMYIFVIFYFASIVVFVQ